METEALRLSKQHSCKHLGERRYTERCFDILNGFEMIATRCCGCHKTLELAIKKIATL